jgi:hypothetical protein
MNPRPYAANQDHDPATETTTIVNPSPDSAPPHPPDDQCAYDAAPLEDEWDEDPDSAEFLPPRPRGRLLRPATVLLFAALLASAGFLLGVVLEKHQLPATASATASGARSFAGTSASASGRTGAAGSGGAPATGGANAVVGQVSTVSGGTLYVTDSSGNTIKVTTSAASQITKTATASVHSVHPGDTVVIQGAAGANGTVAATAVRDSGTTAAGAFGGRGSSTGAGTAGGTSSPSSNTTPQTNAGSGGGVNSLFGG